MFTRKTLLMAVFLVGMGSAFSAAEDTQPAKVAPMSESDRKLTKCELHDCEVNVEDVPVGYGSPVSGNDYFEARARTFPHANRYVLGGCTFSEDSPEKQTVKFCTLCREAEKQWFDAHGMKLPLS